MLHRRIAKLESVVNKSARQRKGKPYIAKNWSSTELLELVNTYPDFPPDLVKKYSMTNWEPNHNNLSSDELAETIISTIKRLNELGDDIDLNRIAQML